LWMYVSPVIYPSRLVYDKLGRWGWLYSLNPLVGVLDGFRAALFGAPFPRAALAISAAFAVALFFLAALIFRRSEGSAADLI
jgi:homopolymeric O-antigen transport system permease protein